jgi:hypothetical protein
MPRLGALLAVPTTFSLLLDDEMGRKDARRWFSMSTEGRARIQAKADRGQRRVLAAIATATDEEHPDAARYLDTTTFV